MDVDPIALTSRWAHVIGAIALLGGSIFARLVLLPVLSAEPAEEQTRWHEAIRSKWAKWVGILTDWPNGIAALTTGCGLIR